MTTRSTSLTLCLALALGALLVASNATAAPSAPPSKLDGVIDAYTAVHEGLFRDDLAATQAAAKALATKAAAHEELARAATAVAGAGDIEAARLAFGDASKALLTLLAANPGAAAGLHAFRCPMAKGYQKWVQRVSELRNPYMGKRMPSCGSKAELTP